MLDTILLLQFLRQYGHDKCHSIDFISYDWSTLIRQARRSNLLSRIAVFLTDEKLIDNVPAKPRQHFLNSLFLSQANARSAKWEVHETLPIFQKINQDFILLKGVAYIQSGNNASKGRLFSDTDILVKPSELGQAETALAHTGWVTTKLNSYDQKYYRQWMHEIPALHHLTRHTTLDVHHSIIPPISQINLDVNKLWQDSVIIDKDKPNLKVLSPIDMILHSGTHLFHEGEFEQGLRDISDLDLLIREYIIPNESWGALLERSQMMNVELPLYYAFTYCSKLIETPIPEEVLEKAASNAKFNPITKWFMDNLFLRALIPSHSTYKIIGSDFARWLLFIRSHWIKMPVYILIPHLTRKAWKGLMNNKE